MLEFIVDKLHQRYIFNCENVVCKFLCIVAISKQQYESEHYLLKTLYCIELFLKLATVSISKRPALAT